MRIGGCLLLGAALSWGCSHDWALARSDAAAGGASGDSGAGGSGGLAGTAGVSTGGLAGVAGSAGGTGGVPPQSQSVYYWSTLDAQLFRTSFPDSTANLQPIPIVGSRVKLLGVTADGAQFVTVEKTSAGWAIVRYGTQQVATPTVLYEIQKPGVTVNALELSPDGSRAAFVADLDLAGAHSAYVLRVNGTGEPVRVHPALVDSTRDVVSLAWSRNSRYLAYVTDSAVDQAYELWTVDVMNLGAKPAGVVLPSEVTPSRSVNRHLDWDAWGHLYFTADVQSTDQDRLYRALPDGSERSLVEVGLTRAGGATPATVRALKVSPDGQRIALGADAPQADVLELYVAPLTQALAPLECRRISTSNQQPPPSAQVLGPKTSDGFSPSIFWSPDQRWLGAVADWRLEPADQNNAYGLFVYPLESDGGVRLFEVSDGFGEVRYAAFTSDSKRVLALMVEAATGRLLTTTDLGSSDQTQSAVLLSGPADAGAFGVEGFAIAP